MQRSTFNVAAAVAIDNPVATGQIEFVLKCVIVTSFWQRFTQPATGRRYLNHTTQLCTIIVMRNVVANVSL